MEKVAEAGGKLMFRTGKKQVFLPKYTVTFMAPPPKQPPIFATFKVPLTFNKFDLRDYLLHVYNTPVVGVRSLLRQQPITKHKVHGRAYRPPPIKIMTVQLTEPFVWPRPPTNMRPWKTPMKVNAEKSEKEQEEAQKLAQETGKMALRDEKKHTPSRKELRTEAKRLLKEGAWTNHRELDIRYSETAGSQKS
ncbi:hypothetical protein F4777DRAFT_472014 [Nemania sp. FL0916]|nr:hypothetical protein F4777DRAFT_472014 [Nemania sp. FL0916]